MIRFELERVVLLDVRDEAPTAVQVLCRLSTYGTSGLTWPIRTTARVV
jgi:hypothetical protein